MEDISWEQTFMEIQAKVASTGLVCLDASSWKAGAIIKASGVVK